MGKMGSNIQGVREKRKVDRDNLSPLVGRLEPKSNSISGNYTGHGLWALAIRRLVATTHSIDKSRTERPLAT